MRWHSDKFHLPEIVGAKNNASSGFIWPRINLTRPKKETRIADVDVAAAGAAGAAAAAVRLFNSEIPFRKKFPSLLKDSINPAKHLIRFESLVLRR